ncbi:hypothetical protein [Bradyrhizobium ganzhouense]|uniref:hypothetical protein n=1 Tax=Bradyrhizobium ganzhouense TaxID=1179767 RepID=UPI003CFAE5C1
MGPSARPPGAFQSRLGDVVDAFPSVSIDLEAGLLLGVIAFKQLNFEQGAFMRARLQNTHIVRSMMVAVLLMSTPVAARDPEGRYAQADPEMHRWFEQLKSEGGEACCALSDGNTLRDTDWRSRNGHFQVFLADEWIDVPDVAVVKVPNRFGRTVVWPYYDDGRPTVRCFMPGSMI